VHLRRSVTVLGAGVLACCSAFVAVASPAPAAAPSHAAATTQTAPSFQRITVTFVDHSRPTVDPDGTRSAPSRTLPTDIYIPRGRGRFPLIVHAHGASGNPGKFTQLFSAWARHGYIVAAPAFPLTSDTSGGPTIIQDFVNQPADMSFVLSGVLKLDRTHGSPLFGKIAEHRIGMSGLSLGGVTTYGAAFNTCCEDKRVTAAIIMSGIELPFGTGHFIFDKPIMIMHGTADPVIPYNSAVTAYAGIQAGRTVPKFFVSLLGAGHAPPYEDTPDPHDAVVTRATIDFWNAYLGHKHPYVARLEHDANVPNLATIAYDTPR
jgi:dienelactone hydrolase